jgi:hypothetical protein
MAIARKYTPFHIGEEGAGSLYRFPHHNHTPAAHTIRMRCSTRPTQNAFVDHFNGSFRRELLDGYFFATLPQVREPYRLWPQPPAPPLSAQL